MASPMLKPGNASPGSRGGHARTVAPTGHPLAGSPGWKAYTAGIWAKNHPFAGQKGLDPRTGQPVMPSDKELLAKAHETTWKTINGLIAQLPSTQQMGAAYDAQRATLAPLIEGHKDWLLKAGDYQTRVVNGIAQLAQTQAAAADTAQTGNAALAGAPLGTTVATNVTPAGVASGALSEGGSMANYIKSLVPYAANLGGEALAKVNANQAAALASREADLKQLLSGAADLQTKNYTALSDEAFNTLKANYAALASGDKSGLAAAKLAQTGSIARTKAAQQKLKDERAWLLGSRNAATAEKRAENAISLAASKGQAALTKSDRSALQSGLAAADKLYNGLAAAPTPGKPGAPGSGKTYVYNVSYIRPRAAGGVGAAPPAQNHTFQGASPEEARRKAMAWVQAHPADKSNPTNPGYYTTKVGTTLPGTGGTSSTGSSKTLAPEPDRRMAAWRHLVAVNNTLSAPWSLDALRQLFRSEHPLA